MKKKCLTLFILITLLVQGCGKTKCFEDNARFGAFDTEKTEKFIINYDSTFEADFEGTVESGNMIVKVYNDAGDDIYFFEGKEFKDSISVDLTEGIYYYYIKMEQCKNGHFHNKGYISKK